MNRKIAPLRAGGTNRLIRTEVFGLEPPCPECEGADESEGESEPQTDN